MLESFVVGFDNVQRGEVVESLSLAKGWGYAEWIGGKETQVALVTPARDTVGRRAWASRSERRVGTRANATSGARSRHDNAM